MTDIGRFYTRFGADKSILVPILSNVLSGADDGELYANHTETESVQISGGVIENPYFSVDEGFGLRFVEGRGVGYVASGVFTTKELLSKGKNLRETFSQGGKPSNSPNVKPSIIYRQSNPLTKTLVERIDLLREIDAYIRAKDNRVRKVSVSLSGQKKEVFILRPDGFEVSESRPLSRMTITVVVDDEASESFGGRYSYEAFFEPTTWKKYADAAIRMAVLRSTAEPCPAGQMFVILTNGWAGVLGHEAFGHMLEADFHWKQSSGFTGMVGKQIASPLITFVDEGNIRERRGSLSFDDEGTQTRRNVLVEKGILKGLMHDRLSARILGVEPTGNGRRESFRDMPIPRMTNTFIEAGESSPLEIIKNTENGLFVEALGGGSVDIVKGQYVFRVDLAWIIKNGILTRHVKGATLTGNGKETLLAVDMVGNDLALDNGTGTCGKEGQGVPAGVGQPTIRVMPGGLTVGGTEVNNGGA